MALKERINQFIDYKKISRSEFERRCGLSNGYTRNIKENLGSQKANDILNAYPEINRVWLLTGEGQMLISSAPSINQEVCGNNNKTIAGGNGNSIGGGAEFSAALAEIAAQRRLTEKAQEQFDRLLSILEKMQS
jgi:hypothetical protein